MVQIKAVRRHRARFGAMETRHNLRRSVEADHLPSRRSNDREWRLKLADYLDRWADELKRSTGRE